MRIISLDLYILLDADTESGWMGIYPLIRCGGDVVFVGNLIAIRFADDVSDNWIKRRRRL